MDELELIRRALYGNKSAFSELVSLYANPLLNYIFKILQNREDAEDALQECFIKAYNALDTLDDIELFRAWLYKIATNTSLDMLRKRKHQNTESLQQVTDNGEYVQEIPDDSYSPEQYADNAAALQALCDAIQKLSVEQRAVITLRDIDGFSYDEIAEIMQLPLGTVKSRLSRARNELKKLLEKNRELFM